MTVYYARYKVEVTIRKTQFFFSVLWPNVKSKRTHDVEKIRSLVVETNMLNTLLPTLLTTLPKTLAKTPLTILPQTSLTTMLKTQLTTPLTNHT